MSDPGEFGAQLYRMGCDELDSVQVEFYPNPNGTPPGEPMLYGLALSQSGLVGLDLLPKTQWKRIVAELVVLVEKLP